MARTHGARTISADVKVAAVRLIRGGARQADVARALGIHPSTISRWWSLFHEGGFNALSRRSVSGRPPKLTPQEMRRIREAVARPPSALGRPGRRWSLALLAQFIRQETGVEVHPSHAGRLFPRRRR